MEIDNLIIGAGPAGLAVAGQFSKAGLNYEILEQSNEVASKWHQHYDRLHLHTVKEFSHLPFKEFPENYPQYVSKKQLIAYYENYVKEFNINIRFNSKVIQVSKQESSWKVVCENQSEYLAKNVIIATGLCRKANSTKWIEDTRFKGEVLHASAYKNPSSFINKNVLIIGMGNTGAEIALDLAEHNVRTSILVRSEIVVIPRDLFGNSVQITARKLAKLPWGIGDWIGSLSSFIAFGNLKKYGLPISKIKPAVLRRVYGKTPTIDLGTIDLIKKGVIKVYRKILEIKEKSLIFEQNNEEDIDAIILATGYTAGINDIIQNVNSFFDANGEPTKKIGDGYYEGMYFIGYEKFTYGGVLGTLINESEIILNDIIRK